LEENTYNRLNVIKSVVVDFEVFILNGDVNTALFLAFLFL